MSVYLNLVITLFVGCLNISFGVKPAGKIEVVVVASGCLSLCAGAVSSLAAAMGWAERYNKHDEISTRYSELVREINMETFLSRNLDDGVFRDISDFIRHVGSEITRLEDSAPPVPGRLC